MSDATLPLKATMKADGGYDAPWLSVDGADPVDMTNKLRGIAQAETLQALVDAAATFKAVYAAQQGGLTAPAQQAPVQQPQQAPAAPVSNGWGGQPQQQAAAPRAVPQVRLHPEGKTCNCGRTLEYKVVNRKSDGKQFLFWACPAQQKRDDGHDTEFAN